MPLLMDHTSYGAPIVHGTENTIRVGKYCAIANSVVLDGGFQHNIAAVTGYPLWRLGGGVEKKNESMSRGDIDIGNDVWIGDGALVMSGVVIGDGAVIGARAVVTRDVLSYQVVGGNPARFIHMRFSHGIVERLQILKWWDWPDWKVLENAEGLMSENLDEFLKKHGV